jgi:hypothetical protein
MSTKEKMSEEGASSIMKTPGRGADGKMIKALRRAGYKVKPGQEMEPDGLTIFLGNRRQVSATFCGDGWVFKSRIPVEELGEFAGDFPIAPQMNRANMKARVVHAYTRLGGQLHMKAWFPPCYGANALRAFLGRMEKDVTNLPEMIKRGEGLTLLLIDQSMQKGGRL